MRNSYGYTAERRGEGSVRSGVFAGVSGTAANLAVVPGQFPVVRPHYERRSFRSISRRVSANIIFKNR